MRKLTATEKEYRCIHGTIIRTGVTCKKIPFYMRDSANRWIIVENTKIFQSYVLRQRNCRILIGL